MLEILLIKKLEIKADLPTLPKLILSFLKEEKNK